MQKKLTPLQIATLEQAKRELEKRFDGERRSLYNFIKTIWKLEYKRDLDENRHIQEICRKLEAVYRGEIKRLIINIPPRTLKTELASILFPAWCIGNKDDIKFMDISYSAGIAEESSSKCRKLYNSNTYSMIFPRKKEVSEDQDTKQYWTTKGGGQYYASGSSGTIIGKGCDIMIIDDPLKADDASSDLVRTAVNNNFHDTLESRLNDRRNGAIVIIMQRLHDDDLVGHLLSLEERGVGEKWEKLIIPAIAEHDEEHRKAGESFFEHRFPVEMLRKMQTNEATRVTFSTQYQQNPVNKETQEFHEEWYRYYGEGTLVEKPKHLRVFTTVDPAFKQGQDNDNTVIMTGGYDGDKLYILEYSVGKFSADVMQEKIIYHIQKWKPEKIGIEAFQAQSMIVTFLKNEMSKRGMYTDIEEIRQTGDKLSKIRSLIPYYRRGLIYHTLDMKELENEQKRFPRGKHDDIIDALQMLYHLYELQPNSISSSDMEVKIEWDYMGRPMVVDFSNTLS